MVNYRGIILSLGSNIGDREANLISALSELASIAEIKVVSSIYETEALLVKNQDNFYNIAIEIEYLKNANDLLDEINEIEINLGRKKTIRYGPRIIDIDIIFFRGESISTEVLTIPHYAWKERLFVIEPLCEIVEEFNISEFNINDQKVVKKGKLNYK
ncbi:MAG: 2-amino-4-hydroxy-6-hydroxymethyldihydropteridine diphosphokinase [Candidatus Actinomarina sp.]